jgi:hypothetical protein
MSDEFDLYRNHGLDSNCGSFATNTTPEEFAAKRATLTAFNTTAEHSAYAESVRDSEFARQLKSHAVSYSWGRATIGLDHPDKVLTSAAKTCDASRPKLRQVVDATKRELFLVSPFVPEQGGLWRACASGARVVDNQFTSFHGRSSCPLQIPALPQTAAPGRRRTLRTQADRWRNAEGDRGLAIGRPSGSGSAACMLHAAFDRRRGFIGS